MSFDVIKKQTQRKSVIIFQVDLDINDPSLDSEFAEDLSSYGTPKTTSDIRAYLEGSIRTYSFCDRQLFGLDCFPCLISADSEPAVVNPGIDIGIRATGAIRLKDFTSIDSFELQDLYSNRRVKASFWAKMFSRNEFKYRPARILRGYTEDGYFYLENFEVEHYIVDTYQGPSLSGDISFNLVDILAFTDPLNVKVPFVTSGLLSGPVALGQTAITLNALNTSAEYGSSGLWAIGSEFMAYTINSATTATVVRKRFGTEEQEHNTNASIQKCLYWENENIIDIIIDLLSLTSIPSDYIPVTKWNALKAGELSLFNFTAVIFKPEEVKKLINELIAHAGLTMFTDVVMKEITIIPTTIVDSPVITFTPEEHIKADSFRWSNEFDKLITNQFIRWALRDYSKTEDTNYTLNKRTINIASESPKKFKVGSAGKDILSRWLPNTLDGNQIADQIITKKVYQYGSDIPKRITFETDAAYVGNLNLTDRLWLGSTFQVVVPENCMVNSDGSIVQLVAQCTSLQRGENNEGWKITGLTYTANFPDEADYVIPAGTYLDYNLAADPVFSDILSEGGAKEYTVVIQQGTLFGSTSTATPAFHQGTFPSGATLKLIVYGRILGKGGNGGKGGPLSKDAEICSEGISPGGLDGGPALRITTNAKIDVLYGLIGGGGGGADGFRASCETSKSGKGGGGGQGSQPGLGGEPGIVVSEGSEGEYGENASINAPGTGGGGLGEDGQGLNPGDAGAAIITAGNTLEIIAGNSPDKIKGAII